MGTAFAQIGEVGGSLNVEDAEAQSGERLLDPRQRRRLARHREIAARRGAAPSGRARGATYLVVLKANRGKKFIAGRDHGADTGFNRTPAERPIHAHATRVIGA